MAEHIQAVAAAYTGDQAPVYRKAADSWRQPYWDWAVDKVLPDALMVGNMTVNGPKGVVTVPNPLLTYRFQQFPLNTTMFPPESDFDLAKYPLTVRCPDVSHSSHLILFAFV